MRMSVAVDAPTEESNIACTVCPNWYIFHNVADTTRPGAWKGRGASAVICADWGCESDRVEQRCGGSFEEGSRQLVLKVTGVEVPQSVTTAKAN